MRKLVFPVWLIAAGMTRIEEADAMRGLHTIFEVKMFPKATAPARGLQSQTPLTVHKRRCARACSKACACTPSTAAHAHRRENGGRARPLTGSGLGGPRVVRRLSKSALRRYAKNDAVQPPSVDDSLLRELDEREEALGGQTIWAWRLDLIRKLLLYYVPAAMITLADATMSLVDTLCVGQFGSTIELAALGPNTLVFNFSSYVFLSVGLATNTLVGRYIRQGRPDESGRVVSQALMFAVTAGTIVGGLIYTLGPQLIALTGVSAAVAEPALGYLRVRALSVPLVVSIVALQSGLLAQKNSTLPGLSVVTAAAVNTVLDVVLIRQCGMGVVGAAVATVIGQVIMFALLLPPYLRRDAKVRLMNVAPSGANAVEFATCMGPLFVMFLAKNSAYMLIQSSVTILNFMLVAAHQVMYACWCIGSFVITPLEQCALAFLSNARSEFERTELKRMIMAGGTLLGVCAGAVLLIPLLAPYMFTTDTALWTPMRSVALPGFISMVLAGIDVGMNGLLLAEGQVSYMARAMLINLAATAVYMFTKGRSGTLVDVWWGLVFFFCMRAAQGATKLLHLYVLDKPATARCDMDLAPRGLGPSSSMVSIDDPKPGAG